jgi:hypothetical protein
MLSRSAREWVRVRHHRSVLVGTDDGLRPRITMGTISALSQDPIEKELYHTTLHTTGYAIIPLEY